MSSTNDEDRKYETIGRTICRISYLFYAVKIIAVFSVIALIVLYFLKLPLWLAPIAGTVLFLLYRSIRRFIYRTIIRLARKASGE